MFLLIFQNPDAEDVNISRHLSENPGYAIDLLDNVGNNPEGIFDLDAEDWIRRSQNLKDQAKLIVDKAYFTTLDPATGKHVPHLDLPIRIFEKPPASSYKNFCRVLKKYPHLLLVEIEASDSVDAEVLADHLYGYHYPESGISSWSATTEGVTVFGSNPLTHHHITMVVTEWPNSLNNDFLYILVDIDTGTGEKGRKRFVHRCIEDKTSFWPAFETKLDSIVPRS